MFIQRDTTRLPDTLGIAGKSTDQIPWPLLESESIIDASAAPVAQLSVNSMVLFGLVALCVVLSAVFAIIVCCSGGEPEGYDKKCTPGTYNLLTLHVLLDFFSFI